VCYRPRKWCALSLAMSLLAVAAVGCSGKGACTGRTSASAAGTVPSKSRAPEAVQAAEQIVIDNFTFDPPTLTIPVGAKVTWVNHDDVPHTATSTAKPKHFESGALDTDEKFSHVFTVPGTYEYFCVVHPKMTGQIIVKRAAPKQPE
jgi:plastocyanin